MGTLSRLIIGVAVVSILSSIIVNPGGLIVEVIRLVGEYSGVDVSPVITFYKGLEMGPAHDFAGQVGALVQDFLQILSDHTQAPDNFVGTNNSTATNSTATTTTATATPTEQ